MRAVPLEHSVADLSLRILYEQAPLRSFYKYDCRNHRQHQSQQGNEQERRQRSCPRKFEQRDQSTWQTSDDTSENNQRYAVTNAARRDLFTEPHQEHSAADQSNDGSNTEEPARIKHDRSCSRARALKPHSDAIGLGRRQNNGEVSGILIDCLAALLALFFESFELRRYRRHQLHDDRCRDIRHDVQGEDR